MRRWIFLLLLAVLPLQFAQGAAAAYCAHEKAVTNKHVGHHEHEHQGAGMASSTDVDSIDDTGAADPDCEYCHLGCAQPIGSIASLWIGSRERPAAASLTLTFASHEGQDVERPKWSSAARSAAGRASPTT